jgi:transposase-like protein
MSLTQEQIDYYLEHQGVRCPWCHSYSVQADGELDQDGVDCYQNVCCADCGKEWSDHYKLVDISEVEVK